MFKGIFKRRFKLSRRLNYNKLHRKNKKYPNNIKKNNSNLDKNNKSCSKGYLKKMVERIKLVHLDMKNDGDNTSF